MVRRNKQLNEEAMKIVVQDSIAERMGGHKRDDTKGISDFLAQNQP
jgi:hypothetical protein